MYNRPDSNYLSDEEIEAQKKKEMDFIINSLQQFWPSLIIFLLFPISILQQKRRNITS
ncbi:hypothetical protein AHMF7616_04131 [Adhaeribacter pallidiroseus]|uniref:Uncharacterized protein n=1 Tax=Adhaeribacter pallidiroseus TaxID=2072847 RepID=A0A369QKS7_9BACT|nr:hypothetical protein AHMF7616_04131 [Adhaeribacter pallidiroseus]